MFLAALSLPAISTGSAFAAGARSRCGGMRSFPLQPHHPAARLEYFREPLPQCCRACILARPRDFFEIVQRTQNIGALPSDQRHVVSAGILSGPHDRLKRVADDKIDMVARRQRFIERQRHMHPETVDVRFRGAAPEGSGPPNRHGMPAVPIGQHLVTNWPVLDLGEQPDISLDKWRLEVAGLVENPFTVDWKQFMD